MSKSYHYVYRDKEGNEDEGLVYAKNSKSALIKLISSPDIEEIIELVDNNEFNETLDEECFDTTVEFLQGCIETFEALSELGVDGSIDQDIKTLESALEVLERRCG